MGDLEDIICCNCRQVLPTQVIFPCGHFVCDKCVDDITACLTCGLPVLLTRDTFSLQCYRKMVSEGLLIPSIEGTHSGKCPQKKEVQKAASTTRKRKKSLKHSSDDDSKWTPGMQRRSASKKLAAVSCAKSKVPPAKKIPSENKSGANQSAVEVVESVDASISPAFVTPVVDATPHVHPKKARLLKNCLSVSKPRPSAVEKIESNLDSITRTRSPPLKKTKKAFSPLVSLTRLALKAANRHVDSSDEDEGVFIASDSVVGSKKTIEVVAQVHADPCFSSGTSIVNSQTDENEVGYTQIGLGHLDRDKEHDEPFESSLVSKNDCQTEDNATDHSQANANHLSQCPMFSSCGSASSGEFPGFSPFSTENFQKRIESKGLVENTNTNHEDFASHDTPFRATTSDNVPLPNNVEIVMGEHPGKESVIKSPVDSVLTSKCHSTPEQPTPGICTVSDSMYFQDKESNGIDMELCSNCCAEDILLNAKASSDFPLQENEKSSSLQSSSDEICSPACLEGVVILPNGPIKGVMLSNDHEDREELSAITAVSYSESLHKIKQSGIITPPSSTKGPTLVEVQSPSENHCRPIQQESSTDSLHDIPDNGSFQTSTVEPPETNWHRTHLFLTEMFNKIHLRERPRSLLRLAFDVLLQPLKNSDVFDGLSVVSPVTESAEKSVQVDVFFDQTTVKVDLGKDPAKRNSFTRRQLSFVADDSSPSKVPDQNDERLDPEESEDIVKGTPVKAQFIRVNLLHESTCSPLCRTRVHDESSAPIHAHDSLNEIPECPSPQNNVEEHQPSLVNTQSINRIAQSSTPKEILSKDAETTPLDQHRPSSLTQPVDASLTLIDSESIVGDSEQPLPKRKLVALPLNSTKKSGVSTFSPPPNNVETHRQRLMPKQSNIHIAHFPSLESPHQKTSQMASPPPTTPITPQQDQHKSSTSPTPRPMDTSLVFTDSDSIIGGSEQLCHKRKRNLMLPLDTEKKIPVKSIFDPPTNDVEVQAKHPVTTKLVSPAKQLSSKDAGTTDNPTPPLGENRCQIPKHNVLARRPRPFKDVSNLFEITASGIYEDMERNAIIKLCGLIKAKYSTEVTKTTTHLIVPDEKEVMMTMKCLMALHNGCYVLPLRWVFDCNINKRILPETDYLFKHEGLRRRMMMPRDAALFDKFVFYLSPEVRKNKVNFNALMVLMDFCGCKITETFEEICRVSSRYQAVILRGSDYLSSPSSKTPDGIVQVSYEWFYTCLANYEIIPFD